MRTVFSFDSWRRTSLFKEAMAFNTILIALSILVVTWLSYGAHKEAGETQYKLRGETLGEFLAAEVEFPMLVGDSVELDRLFKNALRTDDIVYVVLFDDRGELIHEVIRPPFQSASIPISRTPAQPGSDSRPAVMRGAKKVDVLVVSKPVIAADSNPLMEWNPDGSNPRTLGHVEIGFSLERQQRLLAESSRLALIVALLTIGIALLLHVVEFRFVLAPLSRLTQFSRQVAQGNLEDRAPPARHQETHELTTAFNLMLDSLERSRRELRQSEERYALAVKGANDGIWDWDIRKEACYFSPRWKSMLGLNNGDVAADPQEWFRRIHPDDRGPVEAAVHDHLKNRSPQLEIEHRVKHADGSYRWVLTRGLAVRSPAGEAVRLAGSQTDISSRKKTEAQLAAAQSNLLESSRKAGMADVATSVLHNIGNVLNSANVSVGLLAENAERSKLPGLSKAVALIGEHESELPQFFSEDDRGKRLPHYLAKLADHLEDERSASQNELGSLAKNIDHIKAIVGMQQSYAGASGAIEPLSFEELVEDSLRLNEAALLRHRVDVVREYSNLPQITSDRHKILQILVNVISNAKYAMDGVDPERRTLTVRTERASDDSVRVLVTDSGMGIAPENITKIFSYGFTTRQQGHGFGLHSAALAANELGGSLVASSEGPGTGATFALSLPIDCPEAPS